MPTNPNMVAIQTVTVGAGGASSIEFTSIPQTYTDLVVKVSARSAFTTNTYDDIRIQFNGSGGTAYSTRMVYGDGSTATSTSSSSAANIAWGFISNNSATANTFGSVEIYIPNYAGSTNKSVSIDGVSENNATSAIAALAAGLWSNTAAITSVKLTTASGQNFVQYSTATLYGVTSAGYGAKATGGIITQDANYYYHTFLASGTFTPTQSLSCDYLVVAGGGGGGGQQGGGGGAGGVRAITGQSLTAQAYTVTVGAGGSGGTWSSNTGVSSGSASTFNNFSASGGGYGASNGTSANAANGGSGGGGAINGSLNGTGNAGSYSPVEGYAGGAGASGDGGAGGGGAGGAGTAKVSGSGNGQDGGVGTSSYNSIDFSTWLSITGVGSSGKVGGGGGGGAPGSRTAGLGGAGGGGNGNNSGVGPVASQLGLANTGGGGGGASQGNNTNAVGGNAGSGVVIVRYAK